MTLSPLATVQVRRITRVKLGAIASHDRRKLLDVVDIIADEFIAQHNIEVPSSPSVAGGVNGRASERAEIRKPTNPNNQASADQ